MKIITLVPVKNEEFILKTFLENASKFSDYIILADQHSTDRTREIALSFEKVRIIDNDEEGHSNSIRWKLLDEARKIPGNNMMIALDADEMISPMWFGKIFEQKIIEDGQALHFSFPWIQLFESFDYYRDDGVWKNTRKTAVWIDDRKIDYKRNIVINDHTSRVPGENIKTCEINEYPILHFQFVFKERTELKQAWYKMRELIEGGNPRKINYRYQQSSFDGKIRPKRVKKEWFEGIELPSLEEKPKSFHLEEILEWFNKYGIEFFESLEIWHIKRLQEEFMKKVGRKPKPKTFPKWLIKLNNIKRKIF